MAKKEAPAGVAPGTGAGRRSGEPLLCNTEPAENPASPVYVLRLEPLPGIDGTRALREALKRLRRNHGLRCLACLEEAGQ
jgi:hypothetical protein